jgi:phosphoribosylformimino-5-aminoimidazole carboxamide ribotide isomerase
MQVIPVIDLKNGLVVHAIHGNRNAYAPLISGLCKASGIFDVVAAFWSLYGFRTIYVADLNAITGQGDHADLLSDVLTAFPYITFWIDSGYPLISAGLQRLNNFMPVLGSECFQDETSFELKKFENNFILSLDYSLNGELGAKSLFSKPDLWPEHIILMELSRVGSNQGPDIERLAAYRQHYPQHKIIAAGGIRNSEDLRMLRQIRIEQALVATALHTGKINPHELEALMAKKK